jgi:CHASE1-domain containing sensor protein
MGSNYKRPNFVFTIPQWLSSRHWTFRFRPIYTLSQRSRSADIPFAGVLLLLAMVEFLPAISRLANR